MKLFQIVLQENTKGQPFEVEIKKVVLPVNMYLMYSVVNAVFHFHYKHLIFFRVFFGLFTMQNGLDF